MSYTPVVYRAALVAFVKDLSSFTEEIESSVDAYRAHPLEQYAIAYKKWNDTALRLLTIDLQKAEAALANPETDQTRTIMRQIADNEVHLSKNLDSFSFDFAGRDHATLLSLGVDRVVQSAYRLGEALKIL